MKIAGRLNRMSVHVFQCFCSVAVIQPNPNMYQTKIILFLFSEEASHWARFLIQMDVCFCFSM